MKRGPLRLLWLLLLLVIASAGAFWLSWLLPTPAIWALAAGATALLAGIGFWKLWRKP